MIKAEALPPPGIPVPVYAVAILCALVIGLVVAAIVRRINK